MLQNVVYALCVQLTKQCYQVFFCVAFSIQEMTFFGYFIKNLTELSWKSEVCCLLFGNFELSAVSQGDLGETEREIGKLARRMQGDIEIHDVLSRYMINNSDGTLYILLGMFLENISVIIYYKHSYFKNLSLGNSTMYSIMEKRNLCNVKPWWCIIIHMMTITECVTYVMKYIHYNAIMCNI